MTLTSLIRKIFGSDQISNTPDEYELIETYIKNQVENFEFKSIEDDISLFGFNEFQALTNPFIIASYKLVYEDKKTINLTFVQYTHRLAMPRKTIPTDDNSIYIFYVVNSSTINLLGNKDLNIEVVEHKNGLTLLRVNKTSYNYIDLDEELNGIYKYLN